MRGGGTSPVRCEKTQTPVHTLINILYQDYHNFRKCHILYEGYHNVICDRIWENPAYSKFFDSFVSYIFDKLYHRGNLPEFDKLYHRGYLPPSFRPIARFA